MRLTDRQQWELAIPEMGYMALLRNLRNFDQAGIKDPVRKQVMRKLADPDEVGKSRQLPFRFWSAYANSDARWQMCLGMALDHSVRNIPELPGRTLILIDTSGSMCGTMSNPVPRGNRGVRALNPDTGDEETREPRVPQRVEAAALFGIALAHKNQGKCDIWGFADSQMAVTNLLSSGKTVLQATALFVAQVGRVGHGTEIRKAVDDTYQGHDRVIIFTDMQTHLSDRSGDVFAGIPASCYGYSFNLAGYSQSGMDSSSPFRRELGGLSDSTFSLIPQLEAGTQGRWPWE
jgi:hypothetical protein